ncbi:MAG: DNA repair protein RecO, partial [Armatimonadetes bacterium]|nr:DNA repair protein RecO [Armatimonadota bacterium]
MPVYKAEGIVLRRRTLGEADRVVVLMTREWGRISCKAKGVRKTTSRLAGRLEPFVHGRFLLGRGRALDVIAQVEVIDGHPALRADLDRMSYASLVAELTDRLVAEREPHEEVFGLLLTALTLLSDADPARGAAWYALQLFRALGYEPVLDRCARCGGAVTPPAAWGTGLGGVLCDGCRAHDPTALLLDGETLGGMRFLARARARDTLRLRMTGRARDDVVGAVAAFAEAR